MQVASRRSLDHLPTQDQLLLTKPPDPPVGTCPITTTTAVRQMTAYSTTTAGGLSVSNQAGLKASFPGSPLFVEGDEGYDALAVKKYLYKILTNTIHGLDIPAAAAYWGFPYGGLSDEAHPSTADLAYSGAPAIDAQTAVGADFASPYMPNLLVPPIEAPTSPVEQQVVISKSF